MENQRLKKVRDEIQQKFDDWDKNVEAKLNPVPIQDLDYWAKELTKVIEGV